MSSIDLLVFSMQVLVLDSSSFKFSLLAGLCGFLRFWGLLHGVASYSNNPKQQSKSNPNKWDKLKTMASIP